MIERDCKHFCFCILFLHVMVLIPYGGGGVMGAWWCYGGCYGGGVMEVVLGRWCYGGVWFSRFCTCMSFSCVQTEAAKLLTNGKHVIAIHILGQPCAFHLGYTCMNQSLLASLAYVDG